jgi:hypothetical protein
MVLCTVLGFALGLLGYVKGKAETEQLQAQAMAKIKRNSH